MTTTMMITSMITTATTVITGTIAASSLLESVVFVYVVVASVINAMKVSQNVACHKMCFSFSSYAVIRTWNMNTWGENITLQIRELCYALMLTIYANYAPEICHSSSKQNNVFRSQKHIFTQNSYRTG